MRKYKPFFPVTGLLVLLALAAMAAYPALVQAQEAKPARIGATTAISQFRISQMGPDGDINYAGFSSDLAYGSGNEYLLVWAADDNSGSKVDGEVEIYGQRISSANNGMTIGGRVLISQMGPDGNILFNAQRPAVAYNSTNSKYLVVWHGDNSVDDENEIYAQFVNAAGAKDGGLITISAMGPAGDPAYDGANPAVAYNNNTNQFLVVWQGDTNLDGATTLADDEFEIYGQLINASSGALVGSRIRISTMGPNNNADYDALYPAVAYNTTSQKYTVVWSADDNTAPYVDDEYEIYGQNITSAGVLDGARFRISQMGPDGNIEYDAHTPDIAFSAPQNEFLVVWSADDDNGGLVDNELEIFGRRINASGGLLGSMIRISTMGLTGDVNYSAINPGVVYASSQDNYLVSWNGDNSYFAVVENEMEIWGQYINADTGALKYGIWRLSQMGSTDGDTAYSADRAAIAYDSASNSAMVVWHGDNNQAGQVDNEFEVFGFRWVAGLPYQYYMIYFAAGTP